MIDDDHEIQPLLRIQVELYEKRIRFLPSLNFDDDDGLLRLMENILNDIFHIADTIPRVSQPSTPTELIATFKGNNKVSQNQPPGLLGLSPHIGTKVLHLCSNISPLER